MKTEILSILRSSEEFVSGQELCERLGVSRTAVWKTIKKLQEEGYDIEGVNRRGYWLKDTPDVITAGEIASCLAQEPDNGGNYTVFYKDTTDSTNTWAKQVAEQGAPEGAVMVADMQTAGKGRRGRGWISLPGQAVYMSLILRPDILPEQASMVTLILGLSTAQALDELLGLEAKIKWPNDVVLSGKKICGILTEMSTQMDCVNYLVAGIGINVNMTGFPEEIHDKATSLRIEKGEKIRRAPVIARVLACFTKNYGEFLKTGDLTGLMEAYNELLINRGRPVRVMEPRREYDGISGGINDKGELLVTKEDGTCTPVYAGEVSVRGIYGYV